MSAPDTNVKRQKKRHKIPLWGMIASVAFAVVLLVGLILWLSAGGNEPGNEEPIDGSANTEATE